MESTSLEAAFASFDETWSPRVLAELNGQHVKVARLEGAFVWHSHADADELFYLLEGDLTVEYRDAEGETAAVHLEPGELTVAPAGVEHRPVADGEAKVLLFEPAGTLNTGDAADDDRTVTDPERL